MHFHFSSRGSSDSAAEKPTLAQTPTSYGNIISGLIVNGENWRVCLGTGCRNSPPLSEIIGHEPLTTTAMPMTQTPLKDIKRAGNRPNVRDSQASYHVVVGAIQRGSLVLAQSGLLEELSLCLIASLSISFSLSLFPLYLSTFSSPRHSPYNVSPYIFILPCHVSTLLSVYACRGSVSVIKAAKVAPSVLEDHLSRRNKIVWKEVPRAKRWKRTR